MAGQGASMAFVKSQTSPMTVSYIEHYLCLMLEDAHACLSTLYAKAELLRDQQTIKRRLRCEGLSFATQSLPELMNFYFCKIEDKSEQANPSFRLRNGYPIFLGRLFRIASRGNVGNELRYKAFEALYSISVAFKKLRGPYREEKLMDQYQKFLEADAALPELVVTPILETAKGLINRVIKNFDYSTNIRPKPGPGATNKPLPHHMRYEPHTIFQTIDDVIPFSEFFYPLPDTVTRQARKYLSLKREKSPSSRFKFVPKTYGKARGICIEHNEVQYLQQGVADWLRKQMIRIYGKSVDIHDQSTNARLAMESSITKERATLDLSEASDRISKSLVYFLFSSNVIFLDYLKVLSAVKITAPFQSMPDLCEPKKFAPMGSALCFPVMTLSIYALCRAVEIHNGLACKKDSYVSVYGDDIIIKTSLVNETIDLLTSVGLKVNSNKSFWNSDFRESCGLHAFSGREVTPVYVKYIPGKKDLTALQSSLANERDLFKKGYSRVAKFVRTEIMHKYPFITDTVPESSPVLGFYRKNPQKAYTLREKFCRHTQTKYYRAPILVDKLSHNNTGDIQGLLRYWTKPVNRPNLVSIRNDEVRISEECCRSFSTPLRRPKVAWRWVSSALLH